MNFNTIISLIVGVIVIIWGVSWEQTKEKLYIRIENLEKEVEKLQKRIDEK